MINKSMESAFQFNLEAMGTKLEIKIFDKVSTFIQEKIKLEVLNFTINFDETYSRFKENSLVSTIAESKGIYIVPPEFVEILEIYSNFYEMSSHCLNPLIGNTISDLGYDKNYILQKKEIIRETPNFAQTLTIHNQNQIEVTEKVLIDIGAMGKGFWADKVCEILRKNNIFYFLVNGSGDMYYSANNNEQLKVGLDCPEKKDGYTEILNQAICCSGTNIRNWSVKNDNNLHHIIDANTNKPTEKIMMVWVKATKTVLADALASTLFFIDPEILQKTFKEKYNQDFEFLILYNNKKILFSKNFNPKINLW